MRTERRRHNFPLAPFHFLASRLHLVLLIFFVAFTIFCGSSTTALAQDPPQGTISLSLVIGGKTVTCTSNGQVVKWMADYTINDGGHTNPNFTIISYNPARLNGWPDNLKLWGMGHECGHAFKRSPDENVADCWSITTGVEQGWFGEKDFDDLKQAFKDNQGDIYHPPGTVRIANMQRCMDDANAQPTSNPPVDPAGGFERNDQASACAYADDPPHIDWHKTIADPTVYYKIEYKNTCDEPIQCLIRVGVGNKVMGSHAFDDWDATDQKLSRLVILANVSRPVSGTLTWDVNKPQGTIPTIRMSDNDEDDQGDWGMSCRFFGQ